MQHIYILYILVCVGEGGGVVINWCGCDVTYASSDVLGALIVDRLKTVFFF